MKCAVDGCIARSPQHRDALPVAGIRVAPVENDLGARLVLLGTEHEFARLAAGETSALGAADRPAGDHLGEGGDVLLGVAAAHPEGVQLENLARQVLVDADLARRSAALAPLRELRVRTHRQVVVQVQQHRRMALDGQQQVAEVAEHVRPDDLALETAGEPAEKLLVDRDREVIGPELREAFDERPLGAHRLAQTRGHFAHVDGPQELRQFLRRCRPWDPRCTLRAARCCSRTASACARISCEGRNCASVSAGGVPRSCARSHSRPSAPIPSSSRGTGPEPEAVDGNGCIERRTHAR